MKTSRLLAGLPALPALVAACGGTASTSSSPTPSSMMMETPNGETAGKMVGMVPDNAEVMVSSSAHYGNILYDKDHFVLYVFSTDQGSTSACYDACSSTNGGWPPLLTKSAPMAMGVNQSLLGTTTRKDGSLQVTFAGHPLYYWSGDTAQTIMCQNVQLHGGYWYVVNPDGTPNKAKGVDTMGNMP